MTAYGRDDQTWEQLTDVGLEFLTDCARRKQLTSYTELNQVLAGRTGTPGFDFGRPDERRAMGHLLWLIVERERPVSGHLISALVVYLGDNNAGTGFYNLAKQFGLLAANATTQDKERFWLDHVTALFAFYASSAASEPA